MAIRVNYSIMIITNVTLGAIFRGYRMSDFFLRYMRG